jgi:hypothetical protein
MEAFALTEGCTVLSIQGRIPYDSGRILVKSKDDDPDAPDHARSFRGSIGHAV